MAFINAAVGLKQDEAGREGGELREELWQDAVRAEQAPPLQKEHQVGRANGLGGGADSILHGRPEGTPLQKRVSD